MSFDIKFLDISLLPSLSRENNMIASQSKIDFKSSIKEGNSLMTFSVDSTFETSDLIFDSTVKEVIPIV